MYDQDRNYFTQYIYWYILEKLKMIPVTIIKDFEDLKKKGVKSYKDLFRINLKKLKDIFLEKLDPKFEDTLKRLGIWED